MAKPPRAVVPALAAQTWDRRAALVDGAGAAAQIKAQVEAGGGRPVWLQDADLHMVILPMSATLDPVERRPGGLFREAASAVETPEAVDVVLNGMTYSFDVDAHHGGSRADTRAGAHGRALRQGKVLGGQHLRPQTARGHLRWSAGERPHPWRIGPKELVDGTGISGGMPILTAGALIGAPGGAPHPDTDRLLATRAGVGWPIIGLDTDRGLVWVVATAWGQPPARGTDLHSLRQLLAALGVDDALVFDGADSTALYIDGEAVIAPGELKDRSAPFGVHLRWAPEG
ncbi:MAG: phosphodiester glycosidase family protein [Deltaproteobacteria bacterium]|nr:phosphodiester glycosidase family protein [Deltaproteobacteria bacterium]